MKARGFECDKQAVGLAHEGCASCCRFSRTPRRSSSLTFHGIRSEVDLSRSWKSKTGWTATAVLSRWRFRVARLISPTVSRWPRISTSLDISSL